MKALAIVTFLLASSLAWCQDSALDLSPSTAPTRTAGVHVVQRLGSQVPLNSAFLDRDGSRVTLGKVMGNKPAIVLPIFYRCQGVCSSETENLLEVLQKLPKKVGRDFSVIIVGIDPQETPAMAEQKFESTVAPIPAFKGTDAGWHFLTGKLDQIRNVTDALGFFYSYKPETDVITHPAGLMFLTHDGRVSAYILNPYTYSPAEFSGNLAKAITSTVGQPVPDEFFGCIHTDPVTGQRSIVILRFLSLFALLTVIGAAGMVWGLSRKTKKLSS